MADMKITMPRGDIRRVEFSVVDSTDQIFDKDFDEIYMTVKKSYNETDSLFQKKLSDGSIQKEGDSYYFTIKSEDTADLKYGQYVFDIELVRGDVLKQTFLGSIKLTEEATHAANED